MARVKSAIITRKKHKKVLKRAISVNYGLQESTQQQE